MSKKRRGRLVWVSTMIHSTTTKCGGTYRKNDQQDTAEKQYEEYYEKAKEFWESDKPPKKR